MSLIYGREPISLEQKAERYLLIAKSRLGDHPEIWIDTNNGYLRFNVTKKVEAIFHEIDQGMDIESLISKQFQSIEALREEINQNKHFDYQILKQSKPMKNINYFSSSYDNSSG